MALDLTSSSTDAEVAAAYEDNADYDLQDSVSMCKDFIQAVRFRLFRLREEAGQGSASYRDDSRKYQDALDAANEWWRVNDSTATTSKVRSQVISTSVENFR